MPGSAPARIVIAGGHSAGHIEPAMNVADAIRRLDPTAVITAIGTVRGLDTELIPARGYPLELIPPVPLSRKLNLALLATPVRLYRAVRAAIEILVRLDAQVVVGFGGYVAVPLYLAARRARIPIVVHEANARPGVANVLAARLTREVFTASASVKLAHATPIGIPLRPAISGLDRLANQAPARARLGLEADRLTLLITGGSQGAQRINTAALAAADAFAAAEIQVLHIAGPRNAAVAPVRVAGQAPYLVLKYLDSMADAYAAADFVLCRSGAMTCAELTAVGLPAAYVPLPLRGGEQARNAEPIVAAGGALLVSDEGCSPEWLAQVLIPTLTDAAKVAAMTKAASGAGNRQSAVLLAERILAVAAGHG